MKLKQVLIFRKDLKMSSGKMAAQAAHASVAAVEVTPLDVIAEWKRHGVTKVVLAVACEEDMHLYHKAAVAAEYPTALIRDEGRTEVLPGSATCLAIGPGLIHGLTMHLPLWKDDH